MKKLLLLCVLIWAASCKEKLVEEPENLIPEPKMTNIIYDLAMLNGAKAANASVLDKHRIKTMPYLYQKYKIDSVAFVESDLYYASKPEVYQRIYQNVLDRIEVKATALEDERKRKSDSLKSANKAKVKSTVLDTTNLKKTK
ncbi:DUF4296 domain-containing protein [Flavobacterium sp. ASW18X]|uniref:DUF4296 domain-containing protein n=1 Tax=Flavobacterium sp. ASW18X TaxID=2572595 RepID=UPI0010ADC241|nr:DUF4296 domain-containing protein [Flavobacterium sp. ASW18X]TKD65408.1 DUF4296 domain-containing protein [Flavobacterium sp. ASW18X]